MSASLDAVGIDYELLSVAEIGARWPQFSLPEGTVGLYQDRGAMVPAGRGTGVMQARARAHGATLVDNAPVTFGVGPAALTGSRSLPVARRTQCRRLVVCADAWTNEVLARFGSVDSADDDPRAGDVLRATRGPAVRARASAVVDLDGRTVLLRLPDVRRADREGRPGLWRTDRRPERSVIRARYRDAGPVGWLTWRPCCPGRDPGSLAAVSIHPDPGPGLPIDAVPGSPSVFVGLGAAHGFKFAPTFGRLLADLAVHGKTNFDLTPYRFDRPGLTDPDFEPNWMV